MTDTENKDNVVAFPSPAKPSMILSRFFQATLAGLQAREREIEREYIVPLREDFIEFAHTVEKEYGVKLGQTHVIGQNGELVEVPPQLPVEEKTDGN